MAVDGGPTRVYLEVTGRRTFAMAIDWPGWGRSGRTPEEALATLAAYARRYAEVARRAGLPFPPGIADDLVIVEELTGTTTTGFGAPDVPAAVDDEPWGGAEADRAAALLRAAWDVLEATAAASPRHLRKGPRGGGRDRDPMLEHVLGAEAAYGRKVGVRHRQPALSDRPAIEAMRRDLTAAIRTPSTGPVVPNGWPMRYTVRRLAWHVLDHAWEMADRREDPS